MMTRLLDRSSPLSLGRLGALGLCALGALLGCDEPPLEPSVSDEYRIFGMQADPPVARPDEQITLTLYDAHPRHEELFYSWSVCLYSYGGASGFECVSPEFIHPIPNEDSPRLTIDLGPEGLDLRGQMSAFEELPDVDGALPSLSRGHDIYISVQSGFNPQQLTKTIKRVRVIDAPGEEPLAQNPLITGWRLQSDTFGVEACERQPVGAFTAEDLEGGSEPTSLDQLIDPDGALLEKGRAYIKREVSGLGEPCVVRAEARLDVALELEAPRSEPLLFEWLADEAPYAQPTLTEASLSDGGGLGRYLMPNSAGALELYFTVRDGAGGFAIAHQALTLIPNKTTGAR